MKIVDGDLLTSNADYICHQVNTDGVMGGGIALQIKNKFPHVFNAHYDFCKQWHFESSVLLGLAIPIISTCGTFPVIVNITVVEVEYA